MTDVVAQSRYVRKALVDLVRMRWNLHVTAMHPISPFAAQRAWCKFYSLLALLFPCTRVPAIKRYRLFVAWLSGSLCRSLVRMYQCPPCSLLPMLRSYPPPSRPSCMVSTKSKRMDLSFSPVSMSRLLDIDVRLHDVDRIPESQTTTTKPRHGGRRMRYPRLVHSRMSHPLLCARTPPNDRCLRK